MSKTTAVTRRTTVIVRQLAGANTWNLTCADQSFETGNRENESEMKRHVEERTLLRMAKVHDILDIWQGRQNLGATQGEFRAQIKQRKTRG